MSRVRADTIVNKSGDGAPDFPAGATVSGAANWNAPTGIATFNKFSGNLTGIATITGGTIVAGVGTITTLSATTVTIGGTLTYEDVTNIDSVGLITARTGVKVTTGGVDVSAGGVNVAAGIATFGGAIDANGTLDVDGQTDLDVLNVAETATFSNPVKIGTGVTVDTVGFSTFSKGMKIGGGNILQEKAYVNSTAWSASVAAGDINLDLGMVHLNTAVLAGTGNTLNITSAVGINTQMAVGDVIAVTGITSVSATTAFVNTLNIDHSTVQVAWSGGSVPSAGSSTGYDVYAFNIIKTASAKYAVIGNQIKAG